MVFEARIAQAGVFKKILDAIKELVAEANFDCNQSGISLQAMDSSHVALVALLLRNDGFDSYECSKPIQLGINLSHLGKILKCAGNDDAMTLKADDNAETLNILFESPRNDKVSEFELKLMDIDSEHLGIPDTHYKAVVKMPSTEFLRICRDLTTVGDTVVISVVKEGVKFSTAGDVCTGNITCRHTAGADVKPEEAVTITLDESVNLTFALRYLNTFAKATSLSSFVSLSMSPDVPLLVEYKIEDLGYIRYYLAPKIEESDG